MEEIGAAGGAQAALAKDFQKFEVRSCVEVAWVVKWGLASVQDEHVAAFYTLMTNLSPDGKRARTVCSDDGSSVIDLDTLQG